MRFLQLPSKLYSAGSSECFGNTGGKEADEATAFYPRSPYAVAKATAHWEVANYREAYSLFACTGILFNHESPLRRAFCYPQDYSHCMPDSWRQQEKLQLGNISIARDWGWAPEYVEAMWRMLQQTQPKDYVIATGETNTLEDFVVEVFTQLGLDWQGYVSMILLF